VKTLRSVFHQNIPHKYAVIHLIESMGELQIQRGLSPSDDTVTFYAMMDNDRIGHAHLSVKGDSGELVVIVVLQRASRWSCLPPFYFRGINYRDKGVGTMLLKSVLGYCREVGVKTVSGTAHGDLKRLIPWYQQHGFSLGENNEIQCHISA
jgi:hypothetical protein